MMASKGNMAPTEPVVEDMYGVVSPFVEENFLNLDEFLDLDSFPEGAVTDDNAENNHEINNKNTTMHTCDSSTVTDSRNSPPMGANDFGRNASATFDIDSLEANQENTGMLCVPQDDLTDLEWFPFMGNTFSAPKPPPTPTPTFIEQRGTHKGKPLINPKVEPYLSDTSPAISALEVSSKTKNHQKKPKGLAFGPSFIVPGKARSKRPRTPVCNWSTRIVSPTSSATSFEHCRSSSALSSDSDYFAESSTPASKKMKFSVPTRSPPGSNENVIMRKCSHCETTKTPQWRTGPKGPKTLCNACGVRYKSGRLVPEYRPASSPTYIPTRHSNSHRKVMEIRKNRELGISRERPLKLKARNNQSNMPVYSVINQTKPNQASSPNPVYSVITNNNSEQEYLHHNHHPASFSFGYNNDVFVDKDAAVYLPHMKHQDSSSFRHMI